MASIRPICPHCGNHCTVRSSKQLSDLVREYRIQCRNVDCGHTFIANMEAVRSLSPSACPNRSIHLPMSAHVLAHKPARADTG